MKEKVMKSRFIVPALLVLGICVSAPRAQAQNEPGSDLATKKVTLNLENADIRYALKLLFQSVGANYQLDQNVQGSVTVSLTDVAFRTALESIMRSTATTRPLTY
jgi:type II secretory pathway component GspD/PulD (secretin)